MKRKVKSVAPARAQAQGLLSLVLGDMLTLDEALSKQPLLGSDADQRFAMALVLSVLRHLGQVDALLKRYLEKPLPVKRIAVMNALRLGVVQLLLMDTPAHAAVNETVALAKTGADAGFAGLLNAVLQRIVREKPMLPEAIHNLPEWLRMRWEQQYGAEAVVTIARIANQRPPLDIQLAGDGWQVTGGDAAPVQLDAHIFRYIGEHASVEQLPGYEEGAFFVQDVAASYPVRLLGEVKELQVLDICAAPGGKTMQLIRAGAFVTAIDKSASRMRVVKQNLKRMRMQANTLTADALEWAPSRAYDAILLDAPCTATGTWRKHPEIVHILEEKEIAEMAALQRTMLMKAWEWLKPGGKLVYCVCSLEPEEGEHQAEWFLSQRVDATLYLSHRERSKDAQQISGEGGQMDRLLMPSPVSAEASPTSPGGRCLEIPSQCFTAEGYLRTLPSMMAEKGGMDGFFAACFVKGQG